MSAETSAKLIALEAEDVPIISGLVQDAVVLPHETDFDAASGRFVMMLTRFRWEEKRRFWKPKGKRARAALQINTVESIQTKDFDPADKEATLALLAITEEAGALTLTFSGGSAIRLNVEAIDMLLSDIGEPFEAIRRPLHP